MKIKVEIFESPLIDFSRKNLNTSHGYGTKPAWQVRGLNEEGQIVVNSLAIYTEYPSNEEIEGLERKWNNPKWQEKNGANKFLNSILPKRLKMS